MADPRVHIYFLVHKAHERFNVGVAKHPLQRWAQIQPHDQTDFRESLVFDVAPEVAHRRVERTLHRSIADARLDMPGSVAGYTEWFDYRAFDGARRFAVEHRGLLGIGDGYTLAKPSGSQHTPGMGRWGHAHSGWESMFPDGADAWNNEVATCVERWADRLLATDSLIGTVVSDEMLYLFFCRERIAVDEASMYPHDSLISILDLASGGDLASAFGLVEVHGTMERLSDFPSHTLSP